MAMCRSTFARWMCLVALCAVVALGDKDRSPAQFRCLLCEAFVVDTVFERVPAEAACKTTLNGCSFLLPALKRMRAEAAAEAVALGFRSLADISSKKEKYAVAYKACRTASLCTAPVGQLTPATFVDEGAPLPDVKVSMAYAGRPGSTYGTVRVTLIDDSSVNRSAAFENFFTYNGQFHYRWTQLTLRTTLVNVTPGVPTNISIGGEYNMTVSIPAPTGSVRGVFIADPCYSSRFIICIFGGLLHVQERLQALFSALGHYDQVDFYSVIGDNFYDRDGTIAPPFFASLSNSIKSKLLITFPGNHDFWMMGQPWLAQPSTDSNGNGFMQYYGQDVLASVETFPYNFSVDPDNESIWNHYDRMPSYANFFSYYHVGVVGFIGYSGAHLWSETIEKFKEACLYMEANEVQWLVLLGHWNSGGDGADLNMTTNNLYHNTIINLPGCATLGTKRIKYLLGHTHCNVIDDVNRGFMVGGFGMGGGAQDCGDLGLPYLEADASQLLITYFPITHRFNWWDDQYDAVMQCISTVGLSNCRQLGRVWLNVSMSA